MEASKCLNGVRVERFDDIIETRRDLDSNHTNNVIHLFATFGLRMGRGGLPGLVAAAISPQYRGPEAKCTIFIMHVCLCATRDGHRI
jgi:hypothetical protein